VCFSFRLAKINLFVGFTYKETSIANKMFNDLRLKCLINERNTPRIQVTEAMSARGAIITQSNPETS
jgi:hypothetical protein